MKDQIASLTQENVQLKNEVVQLKTELSNLTSANETLKESNRTLQAQIHTNFDESSESEELKKNEPETSPTESQPKSEPQSDKVVDKPATKKLEPQPRPVVTEKEPKSEPEPEPKGPKIVHPETSKDLLPADKFESVGTGEGGNEADDSSEKKIQKLTKKVKRQTRVIYQLQNTNAELSKEIDETREKLVQQVKVSETLQKNLEDTREEVQLVQKKQKKVKFEFWIFLSQIMIVTFIIFLFSHKIEHLKKYKKELKEKFKGEIKKLKPCVIITNTSYKRKQVKLKL